MADSKRVAYEKELAKKLLQQRIDRAKEGGYKTKEELRQERVAQQKTNTSKLLTPGTRIKGLVGPNTAPFDATSVTFNGLPALSAKGAFVQQNNQFGKPGYLPESIQYAGTTLYGQQKGDNIFYTAKNKTPLMQSFKPIKLNSLAATAEDSQDLRAGRVPDVPVKPTNGGDDGAVREETTKTNINGVEQRGTVLSPMAGANEALRKLGVTTVGYGKFQSNHLPGSDYSPEVEKALSKIYDSETLHNFNSDANDIELSEDLFIDRSGVKGEGSFYADNINYDDLNSIDMAYGEGSPFLVRNGDSPITSIVESQKKLGTRARYDEEFLNSGDNPMAGLKAAEASKGLLYASGGYYRENPKYGQEGEKDYLKIDEDVFKAIKNSDMNAQDFFESKLAEIKGE